MNEIKQTVAAWLSGAQKLNKKLVFAMVGVVAIAAFVLNSSISASTVQQKVEQSNDQAVAETAAQEQLNISAPVLYVHVVGEVKNPGIYLVDSGSRVVDALVQAGGLTKKADESSVNLARPLTDGEQVIVLRRTPGAGASLGGVGSSSQLSATGQALISLNRASSTELEALPGVGPTLAQRIVDYRQANGGFRTKQDLQNVAGIGDKMFAAIEPLVVL